MSSPNDDNSKKEDPPNKNDAEDSNADEIKNDATSIYTLAPGLNEYLGTSSQMLEMYPGVESMHYDFVGERVNLNGTTIFESIVHLIKNCLGAGVLSIHEGFKIGGLWTSLVGTFIIGALEIYVMFIMIKSAHKMYQRVRVPRLSYPDLAEAALATGPMKCGRRFSKCFRYIVDICLVTQLCSTCCIYEIMIAKTLKQVLEGVSTAILEMDLSLRIYIMMIMPIVLILCLIRNLKFLAPFSLIADVFVGMAIVATVYYSVSAATNVSVNDRPAWKGFSGLFHFSGICLYSVDGVAFILPVENHMRNPMAYAIVICYAMPTVVIAVAIVGFSGYYGWGEECKSPLTLHLPLDTGSIILQHLLVATLTVTFSLGFWVAFRTIWHYMGKPYINSRRRGICDRLHRAVLVFVVTACALALPELIEIISFIGAIILSLLVFVFPPFIEILVTWCERHKYRRCKLATNILIMCFGAAILIGGACRL